MTIVMFLVNLNHKCILTQDFILVFFNLTN